MVRETVDGIPGAELTLAEGAKHAAFDERKLRFDSRVRSFFRSTSSG